MKRPAKHLRLGRSLAGDIVNVIFLVCVALFMALPLVFAISSAFKPLDEIFVYPPRFFVNRPTLDNFSDLMMIMNSSWVPFTRYLFNTLLLTVSGTLGNVIVCSMAAYMLEKRDFPGAKLLFRFVVLALMFSVAVTAIPNYIIMSRLGWIDTYLSLIIPAMATPLGLFLMKQFMSGVPDSLLESARLDGAGEWRIFSMIVMPLVRPAWLTLIIFSFQGLWGMTGGIYLFSEEIKTLPYAFNQIMAGGIARTGVGSAVALLMMSVPIVVFIFSQSRILQTMAASGIKE